MRHPSPFAAVTIALCCVGLILGLASCDAAASPHTAGTATVSSLAVDASPLVRLHAFRTSGFPENAVGAFDETSDDAARITQLYDTIRALKPLPPGVYDCPNDLLVSYALTFTRADGTQFAGVAKPDGCEFAGITNDATGVFTSGAIVDWNGFWPLFAATFGVPMSALDITPSGAPYAPVSVP